MVASAGDLPVEYQSPLAGAKLVRPETNIILRTGARLDPSTITTPHLFDVSGSASGSHSGVTGLSDDRHTVVFLPQVPFANGETVTVRFGRGLRMEDGSNVLPTTFSFKVSAAKSALPGLFELDLLERMGVPSRGASLPNPSTIDRIDTLPLSFPHITSTVYGGTAPGRIFLADIYTTGTGYSPYLMILDDSGAPVFYRQMGALCLDFKLQPTGVLTYFDASASAFYAMDSNYVVVDSFRCANGYATDPHELLLLPNGHALLLGDDPEQMDMSTVVPGGNPNAVVTGNIVQELDSEKNVIFQWRTWDHFQITDATHEDLTAAAIDYVHANALEVDADGNIILSSRHMDEITKIDRETGDIIWRFGGKHNQFTFVNDSIGISHQHAIRRLNNGHFVLLDNGNFHTPHFSRAVEYSMDLQAMTATLVWQYRNTPDIVSPAMGYVQRLSNGNTLIGWGAATPSVIEVQPDGSKVLELSFDSGVFSYRAFRFDWKPSATSVAPETPAAVSLTQNYPNPFNGITKVIVNLALPSVVTFGVYDILGKKVMSVLDHELRNAGVYTVVLDCSHLASGTYFYRLSTNTSTQVGRMVLLR